MTVIAYRDGLLCADTMVTSDNGRVCGHIDKIGRAKDGSLWAIYGTAHYTPACVYWINGDRKGDPPGNMGGERNRTVFIVIETDGRVREWWGDGWYEGRADLHAWGSGEEIAMGAMLAGADAKTAVEIAMAIQTDCGGEAMCLTLAQPITQPEPTLEELVDSFGQAPEFAYEEDDTPMWRKVRGL